MIRPPPRSTLFPYPTLSRSPGTLKTVAQIPTGEGPHEITVSDDGKMAFVANYGARTPGNTISVMDLVARKETRRVDLGALRRSEEHTSELQSQSNLVCRLLL